jgi:TatD DNase family protein
LAQSYGADGGAQPNYDCGVYDSHCHLHDERLLGDAAAAIARAQAAGVTRMLLAGVAPDGWLVEDRLCAAHPQLRASYGIHPQLVAAVDDGECDRMLRALDEALARRGPHVVALGEVGLDGVGERAASLARQERVFVEQLALARRHRLPVALHVLKQHPRALALLAAAGPLDGVLHSCSAPAELAREYVALGLHLSFSGSLTWHGGANKTARALQVVPRARVLVETDAPDQTPEPARPGRNEPAFLVAIVAAVAQIWGVEFAEAARVTDENARRLLER